MSEPLAHVPHGALWQSILERTRTALACGALQPIETEEALVDDAAVQFTVRSLSSLERKTEAAAATAPNDRAAASPFLPPDPALTLGALSSTHTGVLNKHPVVAHHLLIVTRQFVPQELLLDAADFAVLARCLGEIDALGFYNGGQGAGASQSHKHLQLVPLPLGGGAWDVPIEALLDAWSVRGAVLRLLRLPFEHAFALLEPGLFDDPARAAERMQELYAAQTAAIGVVRDTAANDPARQSSPYNLLVTRRWMLAVPRSQERFGSISVNALGFAGSLFVRDRAAMHALRAAGPMNVLRAVAAQ